MKLRLVIPILLLAAGALPAACATGGLTVKQTTVVSLQASTAALAGAQTLERALCFNNPAVESGVHCTNPVAAQLKMTDDLHVRMATFFADAFGIAIQAATVIPLWTAGAPPPTTVLQYMTDLNALLAAGKTLDPAANALLTQIQTAVTAGASAASALGVK